MKKILLIFIFSFFSFFCIFFNVKAVDYNDNFDTCFVGDTVQECSSNWTTNQYFPALIDNSKYNSIPNSFNTSYSTSQNTTVLSFSSLSDFYLSFYIFGSASVHSSWPASFGFRILDNNLIYYQTSPEIFTSVCVDLISNFNHIQIKRVSGLLYFKCNDSIWTEGFENNNSSITSFFFNSWSVSYSGFFDDVVFSSTIPAPDLNIESPLNYDYLSQGEIIVSGTCPVNGSDEVYLTDQNTWNCESIQPYYNVDCVDNNFSATTTAYVGNHEIVVYDRNCYFDTIAYTGLSYEYDYNIALLFPLPNENGNSYTNLESNDNYKFRFGYSIPTWDLASTTIFSLYECNAEWECGIMNFDNTLTIVDPDEYGYVDTEISVPSEERMYYQLTLSDSILSTIYYRLRFTTYGLPAGSGIPSSDPEFSDSSWLEVIFKKAFVPKPSTLHLYTTAIPNKLQNGVPFAYFYYVKNEFDSIALSTSTIPAVSVPLKVGSVATITIPFLDFSHSIITDIVDDIRPFLIAFLWFGFGLWLIHRITNLNV